MRLMTDKPMPQPEPAEAIRLRGVAGGVRVRLEDGETIHYPAATEYAIAGGLLLIETESDTLAVVDWQHVRTVEAGHAREPARRQPDNVRPIAEAAGKRARSKA